jgi:hypothetical protein
MDPSVLAAIAKWPDVPDVFGWLTLTARGEWRLRGAPIVNPAICEFIGRNYAADERGRWYFQNGPQRVYVTLELAPWVYRVQPDGPLLTFTGLAPRQLQAAALVDGAAFVLLTDLGPGNIDDRDTAQFLSALADSDGRTLDGAALEDALGSDQPVFVAAARLELGAELVPLRRLVATTLQEAFGFSAAP